MGLREKSDFNLQTVSLFIALLTILFLCAARHYTSDWRERRVFRRHLVQTQTRLKHTPSLSDIKKRNIASGVDSPESDLPEEKNRELRPQMTATGQFSDHSTTVSEGDRGRRRWKRFIAALPFMPLATAYVAARIGWDLFELLVFCSIDAARDTAITASASARSLAVFAYTNCVELFVCLNIKRRAQDAAIAIVENTVVLLFQTVFPAVGELFAHCISGMHIFAEWWMEYGGPAVRDALEKTVLGGIVPAYHQINTAVIAVCTRSLWLCTRVYQAIAILAKDFAHDIAIAYRWTVSIVSWITSRERWWFNPKLQHLMSYVIPSSEQLAQLRRFFVERLVSWCIASIEFMVIDALLPCYHWCSRVGDQALQLLVGVSVRAYSMLLLTAPTLFHIVELLFSIDLYAPLITTVIWLVNHGASTIVSNLTHAWHSFSSWILQFNWILSVCLDRYSRARDNILIPMIRALSSLFKYAWLLVVHGQFSQAIGMWLKVTVWPFIAHILAWCLVASQNNLASLWITIQTFAHSQQMVFHRWYVYTSGISSSMAGHIYYGVLVTMNLMQIQAVYCTTAVWPVVQRGVGDGLQAMGDVYVQLAAAVDLAVATVGDLVVEFARRNTVHASTHEQSGSSRERQAAVDNAGGIGLKDRLVKSKQKVA
ncbi:hypothetical protein BX070DRAFT_224613 [Coemansia spiralis]|nr:hypothetical protein BX070DRAFT_224613 [Coemansia spiralis]